MKIFIETATFCIDGHLPGSKILGRVDHGKVTFYGTAGLPENNLYKGKHFHNDEDAANYQALLEAAWDEAQGKMTGEEGG